jgi:hypothetical protein
MNSPKLKTERCMVASHDRFGGESVAQTESIERSWPFPDLPSGRFSINRLCLLPR